MTVIQQLRDNANFEYEQARKFKRDPEMFWSHQGRAEAFDEAADMLEEAENS